MIHERVQVPSSQGTQIHMDVYVPYASKDLDPHIRRPAIVVCPGGGYRFCSEREAEPIALRFLAEGFNVFVIWYRVNKPEGYWRDHDASQWYHASTDHVFPLMQHDAASAIAYVRSHAEQYHTDPDKIAIMGFSAGGHLAASVSALWHHADMWEELGLTPEQVRPNAAVLCYPVIVSDKDAHRGSFENLTGTTDPVAHAHVDVLNWVDEHFPPTFLWHTFTDPLVPVQNSLRLALALANAKVSTELHVFPRGGHGLALANEITCTSLNTIMPVEDCAIWPQLAARFLKNL